MQVAANWPPILGDNLFPGLLPTEVKLLSTPQQFQVRKSFKDVMMLSLLRGKSG